MTRAELVTLLQREAPRKYVATATPHGTPTVGPWTQSWYTQKETDQQRAERLAAIIWERMVESC